MTIDVQLNDFHPDRWKDALKWAVKLKAAEDDLQRLLENEKYYQPGTVPHAEWNAVVVKAYARIEECEKPLNRWRGFKYAAYCCVDINDIDPTPEREWLKSNVGPEGTEWRMIKSWRCASFYFRDEAVSERFRTRGSR
ncbi:hypothetical protein [Roseomonas chloroacetimidivorans]|uniref:hypothetical protein n=1 Tax=Roseomonas chloroacetimidivorans TaxID=1766656 RepID=UPI003C7069F7